MSVVFTSRFGRKKVVIVGIIVWIAGFFATTFSVNIYMFMALRIISAVGQLGGYMALYVLGKNLLSYRVLLENKLSVGRVKDMISRCWSAENGNESDRTVTLMYANMDI